jgi:hypothetical protein
LLLADCPGLGGTLPDVGVLNLGAVRFGKGCACALAAASSAAFAFFALYELYAVAHRVGAERVQLDLRNTKVTGTLPQSLASLALLTYVTGPAL